jgi:transposase-like protein
VAEVLPLLYLHGLSSSDFGPALTQFLGTSHGLSAATITRLTKDWQDEATTSNKRSLAGTDYVYCWVDGIHLKVRLEQDKVCLLVMIGVRADGTKKLIALDDGHRESTESWLDLLRGCKRRGMAAPVLAVGDGALGFWSAVREVFPETREQRCWWHRSWQEIMCRFRSLGLAGVVCAHAHTDGGPWSTRREVRGLVAASERAPAALGVGGRGAAAGARWRPRGRAGG